MNWDNIPKRTRFTLLAAEDLVVDALEELTANLFDTAVRRRLNKQMAELRYIWTFYDDCALESLVVKWPGGKTLVVTTYN